MFSDQHNKPSSRDTMRIWKQMNKQSFKSTKIATGRTPAPRTNDTGAAAVEFALVLPVLLMILFAITAYGVVFNNYIQLSNGVRAVSRVFAAGRGSTTPLTTATNAFASSAPSMPGTTTFTFKVNGTACATDAACVALLTSSSVGQPAAVTASNNTCDLRVMGVNYAPGCSLSFTTTEIVE